jgi:hypothetical protein
MNAYLTSSAQSAILLSAAGIAARGSAEFVVENSSQLLHSAADLDGVEADLIRAYGGDRVTRMSPDVLVYEDSYAHVIQRLPGEGEPPVLDFTELTSPVRDAKPIVLFLPGLRRRYTTFTGLIDAFRCFGYDIRTVGKHKGFRGALQDIDPDIVCLSTVERYIGHLAQAYQELVELSPGAVTLLGGYAAFPSAADFFDIVVPGEGDIALPLLLRFLQGAIAAGRIPTDSKADGGMLPAHLPIAMSDEIRALTTRRVFSRAGTSAEIEVDSGSHLYIRGREDNGGLRVRFSGDRMGWPIPMNEVELNTLWRVPGDESLSKGMFYAQRGCKPDPDKRCQICSITSQTGREVKPGDAVDALREFRSRGAVTAMLADENFSNSPRWTHEFLDGIEREGLFQDMRILMQIRADTWNEELVRRFWDMGVLVGVGLETLHPLRAERLGKVLEGRGERYVERGAELLRLLTDIEIPAEAIEARGPKDLFAPHLLEGTAVRMYDLCDVVAQPG